MDYGNLAYKYEPGRRKTPIRRVSRTGRPAYLPDSGTQRERMGGSQRSVARTMDAVQVAVDSASVERVISARISGESNISQKDQTGMVYRRKTLVRILYVLTIALAASYMISKFVAVYETESEIKALTREVETMQAANSQKIFEMEQSVDLTQVEQDATERLGMQRPEKYQTVYVDVKQADVTEVTAGDVEGIKSRTGRFFGKLKRNIVEAFSIE